MLIFLSINISSQHRYFLQLISRRHTNFYINMHSISSLWLANTREIHIPSSHIRSITIELQTNNSSLPINTSTDYAKKIIYASNLQFRPHIHTQNRTTSITLSHRSNKVKHLQIMQQIFPAKYNPTITTLQHTK